MTTLSLQEQLGAIKERNRLVTGVPAGSKERPSFLFEPSKAADYDNDAIYALAQPAFVELCAEDRRLHAAGARFFEAPRFGDDLSLQTVDIIEKEIRPAVSVFLRMLCTAHLSKPTAHRALEWMVRRWRVVDMFADELMAAMVLHHDTVPFVRMVQVMYFAAGSPWAFLAESVQKTGKPLERSVLARRVIANPALGAAVHGAVLGALADASDAESKAALSAARRMLSFYVFVSMEALQQQPRLEDAAAIRAYQQLYMILAHEPRMPDAAATALSLLLALSRRTCLSQAAIDAVMDVLSAYLPCPLLGPAVSKALSEILAIDGITSSPSIEAVRSHL